MPAEPDHLTLAGDFPTPDRAEWRELVEAVLKKSGGGDADPEQSLAYTTYDGIEVKPLYTAEDTHGVDADGEPGHPPYVRGATGAARDWDVRVRHAGSDAATVNEAVLADLETGATSLWLVVGDGTFGVDELPALLNGVYLDLAPVALDAGVQTAAAAAALVDLAGDKAAELSGSFGADPVAARARTGAEADLGVLADLVEHRERAPKMRLATVDGTVFHDAGASDAQEIGIATAVGVTYLRALTEAGLSVDEALDALEFRFAVTAEQFPSIAKLRAARRVWGRVAELCEAATDRRGQFQHAVTSSAMLTRRDPWVNMLRSTIGCFAGAIGGADAITVAPFDAAIGVSDAFARRVARNTHAVLHDESSLSRVADAAGGSWYVESFTDALADAAWTVFTDIEKNGGVLTRLDDGTVAKFLADVQGRRADDIAHRRAPITGVSEFAFVEEKPVEREPLPERPGEGLLPRVRYAQDFEALRDRADAAAERPTVFLATLGSLAEHSTRAGFAANLFQSAGIECVRGPVEEYADAGTPVACLCSTDDVYDDEAEAAAKSLRDAGASKIWIAGRVDVDGVDGQLHAGGDALDVLTTTLADLGVE